jgi:hypothetical protein
MKIKTMDQETLDKLSDEEILAMRGMTKEQAEEEAKETKARKQAFDDGKFFWKQNGETLELRTPPFGSLYFSAEIEFDLFDDDDIRGSYYASLKMTFSSDTSCIFYKSYDTIDEAKRGIESELNQKLQELFKSALGFLGRYFPGFVIL